MARINTELQRWLMAADPEKNGHLVVEEFQPNSVKVYFVPPRDSLLEAELDPDRANEYRVLLLLINGQKEFLTIYPTNTFGDHPQFLKQKYDQIKSITLANTSIIFPNFDNTVPSTPEDVFETLEKLPSAFTKNYSFGLGLAQDYRFIIHAVEELSKCNKMVISRKHKTKISASGKVFYIAERDFEEARLMLNRLTRNAQTAARSVKESTAYNILAKQLGLPSRNPKSGRSPLRKIFTAKVQGKEPLSENEQSAVLEALTENSKEIAEKHPGKLAKLHSDIELVTLEKLIKIYDEMMRKRLEEKYWQTFFNENPFILNMAFGYPLIKIQDQASVGGRKFSGRGEKIADFLVKNTLTNNAAIFEIKKPQVNLLNRTSLRDGIFTPSSDLSGSINQTLDQKYQFQREISQFKDKSRIYDIESYAVHCCLIIGTIPEGDEQKKSFELFRRNSKDVEIVTFDELLEKLKQLRDFLKSEETDSYVTPVIPVTDDELPF